MRTRFLGKATRCHKHLLEAKDEDEVTVAKGRRRRRSVTLRQVRNQKPDLEQKMKENLVGNVRRIMGFVKDFEILRRKPLLLQ